MANYLTVEKVKRAVPERDLTALANDFNKNAALDDEQLTELIESIIEDAEAFIDSYLRVKYSVPVTTNNLIERFAMNVAKYYLYERRTLGMPASIRENYNNTVNDLEEIRDGIRDFGGTISSSSFMISNKNVDDRMFARNSTDDYDSPYNLENY